MERPGRLIGGGGVEEVTFLYAVIVWKKEAGSITRKFIF